MVEQKQHHDDILTIPDQSAQTNSYEEPEGIETNDDVSLGEYPIDSVLIRNETRTVFEIVRRINTNNFILDPDFQREFVWELEKQSRLIESALMRIPLPVFYLAEQGDGKVVIVDGLQRLTTFRRYLNNDFPLKLGSENTLNKKRFNDLIPKLQTRLEDTQLILFLIDSKVPERARLDIFERVNSGVPLSRQQMRNSLYLGKGTRWLKEQARSEWFVNATGGSLNQKTMRDRELINRFCGFYLLGVEYYTEQIKGDMDTFLAKTLQHMNTMTDEALQALSKTFETSLKNNYTVFGKFAFRKHTSTDQKRNVINVALFDVFSVTLTKYEEKFVKENASKIRSKFYRLMGDYNFEQSITLSTNSSSRVKERFNRVTHALEGK